MTNLSTTYATLRAELTQAITSAPWPSPEAGFLDYLQTTTGTPSPQRPLATDRLGETPMLASAGYQYVNPTFARPTGYDDEWARHFRRLAQRQAFPLDRESYFYRPLDLLGICIGAHSCPALNDEDRKWLQQVLKDGASRLADHSRAHYLGAIAATQVGVTWTMRSTPRVQDLQLSSLSLLYWIASQDNFAKSIGLALTTKELAGLILDQAFAAQNTYDDLADAGLIPARVNVSETPRSRIY